MTGTYDWNPMPHKLDVRCPSCSDIALFEFAEVVRIKLKKDVEYFNISKQFEYEMFTDSCGHKWHGAIFYAGLHGGSVNAINQLPRGYESEDWAHSKYLYRGHGLDIGSINCAGCNFRGKHQLSWPSDAYYLVEYKGNQLWGFNRESAMDLRDYIHSKDREIKGYKWSGFLLHIPTIFKKQGAREHVVKQLNKLLSC